MNEIIKEILSKESLSDTDINILMKNKDLLEHNDLVRLGLAQPIKVEVKPEVAPEEPAPVVETPKKRTRKLS